MRYHAARCHEGRDSQSSSNVLGGFETRFFPINYATPQKLNVMLACVRITGWLQSSRKCSFSTWNPLKPTSLENGWKWFKQLLFHSKGLGIIIQLKNPIYKWMAINFQVYFPKLDHSDESRVTWRLKFHHPYQRIPVYLWTRQKVKVRGSMVILHWMIQL